MWKRRWKANVRMFNFHSNDLKLAYMINGLILPNKWLKTERDLIPKLPFELALRMSAQTCTKFV